MKMKSKGLVCTAFACMLAVSGSVLAGCGGGGAGNEINMNIDLNDKPALNILMPNSGRTIAEVNADSTVALIEQITGYTATYTQLPASNASTTLNNELMDKRHYNAIKLTKDQFADLVKDGMLTDITDALSKFAPDMLDAISEESWEVVTYDGRIYGIPERASSDNIENTIVFNYDLMLENNLDVPVTRAEFTEVLRSLKSITGSAPLTFDQNNPLVYSISASFGIYSDWQEYETEQGTKVLYYMNAPRYGEYVDYMSSLYKEGLIDPEIATNSSSDAMNKFVTGKASCYACSVWNTTAIVNALQTNGKITATEAAGTLDNYLYYLRALKENAADNEKVYRSSGYTYITAIPFYEAENAGYALDWMNSKIKDTEEAHNFRDIVLGTEGYHWTYSATEGYYPIAEHFSEKDEASYFLTGSNEKVYTEYWKARVRKQPELYRAWSTLMTNADDVGVYNIVDFTPPIADYTKYRSSIELYAQDQTYNMFKNGTGNLAEYINTLNTTKGGNTATAAINSWYASYKK